MSHPQKHAKPTHRILDFRFWIIVILLSIAQSASAHKMEVAEADTPTPNIVGSVPKPKANIVAPPPQILPASAALI